jgi:hypothetical protein
VPEYLFENAKTKEVVSVFFHMTDDKVYLGKEGKDDPKNWKRVWTKPQAAIDSKNIDPYSAKDFNKATNKNGTIGDLWDRSREMSMKRADKDGVDPVEEKWFDNYAKKRRGKEHPTRARRKAFEKLKTKGIRIEGPSE